MGPPQRVRYNAKARQSNLGGPAKKRRRVGDVDSSNVEVILPQEAKEEKARRDVLVCIALVAYAYSDLLQLREMRNNLSNGPISSKKKKRMEKYIVSPPTCN
jgi:hypothetical protein